MRAISQFDLRRFASFEHFEHVRRYGELLNRLLEQRSAREVGGDAGDEFGFDEVVDLAEIDALGGRLSLNPVAD